MRTVNISLGSLQPSYEAGYIGEANATQLNIDISSMRAENNQATFYMIRLQNSRLQNFVSRNIAPADSISLTLWQDTTQQANLYACVEGYAYTDDENGNSVLNLIHKSPLIHLTFKKSINAENSVGENDDAQSLSAYVAEQVQALTTVVEHKQDELSDDDKLAIAEKAIDDNTVSKHTSYSSETEEQLLAEKQPLLTAGENIAIENNVISATGGGDENNWRLIRSFVIPEDVTTDTSDIIFGVCTLDNKSATNFQILSDNDGNEFEIEEMFVTMYRDIVDDNSTYVFGGASDFRVVWSDRDTIFSTSGLNNANTYGRHIQGAANQIGRWTAHSYKLPSGLYQTDFIKSSKGSLQTSLRSSSNALAVSISDKSYYEKIKNVKLMSDSAATPIMAGTIVEIWGR